MNLTVAQRFFGFVVAQAEPWVSDEHLTVDDPLIEAPEGQESSKPKGVGPDDQGRSSRGQTDTHASKTGPDARLHRKSDGVEA